MFVHFYSSPVHRLYTGQKSHYPPGNHHASNFYKCPIPGHNHLLITSTDDPSPAGARVIIKVSDDQYRWLACGYDLEIGHF